MPKKNTKVHFSSNTDEWATPISIFNELSELYGPFELDVCASDDNTKCSMWYNQTDDGLNQNWQTSTKNFWANPHVLSSYTWIKTAFMNPPYSDLKNWMKKAYEESRKGMRVVCLIPARTDTKCFHEYVIKAEEVLFVKGRIKFGNAKNSAPFPSMIVVFDPSHKPVKQFGTIEFGKSAKIQKKKIQFKKQFDGILIT